MNVIIQWICPLIGRDKQDIQHNFENLYKPLVDEWALYDNSSSEPALIEEGVRA